MNSKKIIVGTTMAVCLSLGTIFTPAFAHDNHNNHNYHSNHNNHHENKNETIVVKMADLDNTSSSAAVVATDGLKKWFMYNDTSDTIDNILGTFVTGPATPPHGIGSIEFTLGANPLDRKNIATYQFSGKSLKSITKMSFSAYSHSGVSGPTESPYLNFNVDFTGSSSTFQRRLVYVPSANGAVPQDSWNTFDVINGGNALWTWSGYASNGNKWLDGNTNQYRTWNSIKIAWPNARLLPVGGWLGIRVGEPGPANYVGNVDSFTIGTNYQTTTFDFEPTIDPPVTYAECKNNGWKKFNSPVFKNQGDCLDYVKKHNHIVEGKHLQYTANGLMRFAEFDGDVAEQDGKFFYKDANHDWYKVDISKVKVNGTMGWFSGKVINASNPAWVGLWLFAKAEDNSPDKVWGSFTDQTTAETGVTNMTNPSDGPFTVTGGNIIVH